MTNENTTSGSVAPNEQELSVCPYCRKELHDHKKQIFQFQGKEIRILREGGEIWYVAKDVCKVFEVKRIKTILKFMNPEQRKVVEKSKVARLDKRDSNGNASINVIHETGVRKLISIASKEANALKFGEWMDDMSKVLEENGE